MSDPSKLDPPDFSKMPQVKEACQYMDSEDTYLILFFGAGSLFALWISSAVISALDSVPVVPKVLEVIGLGFTAWFTSRYFIFKENRDEFFLKLQDVKERILGPSDD